MHNGGVIFFWVGKNQNLLVEIVSYEYKFVGLLYLWLYQIMVVAHDVWEKLALPLSLPSSTTNHTKPHHHFL